MTLTTDQVRELCRIRDAGIIATAALQGDDHARDLAPGANSRELGLLAHAGADARHQLVDNGVGLVKSVLVEMNYHGDWADVFQDGMLAVVKAVDRFDPDRGAFSTFMWPHIKGAVLTAMATDTMRLDLTPNQARDRARVLTEITRREASGLSTSSTDLTKALRISTTRITRAMAYRPHAPLGDPLRGGQDMAIETPGHNDDNVPVGRYVAMLPPNERTFLEHLYGLNGQTARTITQIAATLGCSKSTAHRLQDQAHQHLHELLNHFGQDAIQERDGPGRHPTTVRSHETSQGILVRPQIRSNPVPAPNGLSPGV